MKPKSPMDHQLTLIDNNKVSMCYDLDNPEFMAFFKKTTGYCLMEGNWEKTRQTLANPSVPIASLNFTYQKSGLPLPEHDNQSMRNAWAMTRQKLQDQWDIFTGAKTFNDIYRRRAQ